MASRKHQRKDYSQVVDFPVEIVGRDNLVRRYSYDDAVRLYQRRILSATVRYDDPEVIDAEVHHCHQRIDQLRRSYLEHAGWGWARGTEVSGILGSPLAAEVAAFLRRAFADDPSVLGGLAVTVLQSGPGDVCFLRPGRGERSFLLYAWRLDKGAPDGAKEDYLRTRERLNSALPSAQGERALLEHEGPDVAIILAGEGDWEAPVADELLPAAPPAPKDPWREATRALHDGDLLAALDRFERGMDQQPSRRILAQSAVIVALQAKEPERAEFAARHGGLHHPDDALLRALLAIALFRRGQTTEAKAVVRSLVGMRLDHPLPWMLIGLVAVRSRHPITAWRALRAAERRSTSGPWYLHSGARIARFGLLGAALAAFGAPFGFAGGVMLLKDGLWLGACGIGGGLASVAFVARYLVQVFRAVHTDRFGVIRLVSPELLPREPDAVPHH